MMQQHRPRGDWIYRRWLLLCFLFVFCFSLFFFCLFFFVTGTVSFLKKLASMSDVWVITVSQAIAWIRSPTTLENIEDFAPWKCDSQAPPDCYPANCRLCNFPAQGHVMSTCAPSCPPHYPWVGNPDGNWPVWNLTSMKNCRNPADHGKLDVEMKFCFN